MDSTTSHEYLIVAIENPILDFSNTFDDDAILKKYELAHGQACLAEPKHVPLYTELFAMAGTENMAGGSSLNSVRAASHMLKDSHPKKCVFLGCIGNDEYGKVLEKTLE
jgi:adenosine kinase